MAKPRLTKDEKAYEGLALSYLIDPRPVVYWNIQVKLSETRSWRSWNSATGPFTSKAKADRDLASTRNWIRSEPRTTKRIYRLTAHLN